MKKKTLWIGVIVSLVFFILFCVGYIVVASKINNAVRSVPTSTPPGSLRQNERVNRVENMAEVTISIDLPPSNTNNVQLFGSLIDRMCVSPYNPECLRDYSSSVVSGKLIANFKVPLGINIYYGYVVDNEIYFESTSVNGVDLNRACYGQDKTNFTSWYMVSFRVDDFSHTVVPNLSCQENPKRRTLKVIKTGNLTDLEPFDWNFNPKK